MFTVPPLNFHYHTGVLFFKTCIHTVSKEKCVKKKRSRKKCKEEIQGEVASSGVYSLPQIGVPLCRGQRAPGNSSALTIAEATDIE